VRGGWVMESAAKVKQEWKIDLLVFLSAAIAGLGIWLAVTAAAGTREAWDTDYFFNVGFPSMAFVSGLAGFLRPKHAWRWGIATLAFQPIALYWGFRFEEFGIIGLFFFAAYAVALAFCALGGAKLRELRN
jgi:hypothetical protein